MKTHRSLMSGMAVFVLIIMGKGASPAVAQGLTQVKAALQQEMSCQGATPREKALLRRQIEIMRPEVLPLRVIYITRIYHLHVSTGYISRMFTHLPSRTVFIDTDRYVSDDSLGYWIAHELGHLVTNSAKEEDAEKAAGEYRKRLKAARHELALQKISFSAN